MEQDVELRVQKQLEQLERLERLKRFFSPQLAELIVAGRVEDPLKTHRREVTVVFLDLRGFTAFAETAEPEEVMGVLREYHGAMGKLILEHEGTLERFTGDGMMIFFNDPVQVPNPAERAIGMALAMRERVKDLCVKWRKLGYESTSASVSRRAMRPSAASDLKGVGTMERSGPSPIWPPVSAVRPNPVRSWFPNAYWVLWKSWWKWNL